MNEELEDILKEKTKTEINIKVLKKTLKSELKKYIPVIIIGTILIAGAFIAAGATISIPLAGALGALISSSVSFGFISPDLITLISDNHKLKKLNIELNDIKEKQKINTNTNNIVYIDDIIKERNSDTQNNNFNTVDSKNKILVLRKDK